MKNISRSVVGLIIVATVMSCHDRAAEKKIAQLESRLAAMENKGAAAPAQTPAAAPAATPVIPEEKPSGPLPVAQFQTLDHDFGTVSEGEKVSFTYTVKNTGQAPLIIENAAPSCGCTVPDWTRTPIPVGGSGFVKAEFDTNHKTGVQNKTITVTANTWPKTSRLSFKAMVTAKPDGSAGPVK